MDILVVTTWRRPGGAAAASFRLVEALAQEGVTTRILLLERVTDTRAVPNKRFHARHPAMAVLLERLPVMLYSRRWTNLRGLNFSPALSFLDSSDAIRRVRADIVNLHWVNHGHMSPEGIGGVERPLAWTMHDMWPITGGCHYSGECTKFQESCGRCPVLGSNAPHDWAHKLHTRKSAAWAGSSISVISPSRWLAAKAAESSLFRSCPQTVIPNPLDLKAFAPGDKLEARRRLGLPERAELVLFAAKSALRNGAKGIDLLCAALNMIGSRKVGSKPHLVLAGADRIGGLLRSLEVPVHLLGDLPLSRMVEAYVAADILAMPSRMDNLPNVAAEASACGLPIVAFGVGGLPEIVDHGVTGYIAKPLQVADLAEGILSTLDEARSGPFMSQAARAKAETMFDATLVARRYIDFFHHVLSDRATSALRARTKTAGNVAA